MIKELVKHPNIDLQTPCVEIPRKEDCWELRNDLWQTLSKHGGFGIAAPQIGVRSRAFICLGTFCVDPKIIRSSSSTSFEEEGCLSVPNTFLIVERSTNIKVTYNTMSGERIESKLTGFPARVFQHELDHLDGILILDRVKHMGKDDNKTEKQT